MKTDGKNKKAIITIVLLALSVAMTATGLAFGQNRDVFGKAIKICVECIGLGK